MKTLTKAQATLLATLQAGATVVNTFYTRQTIATVKGGPSDGTKVNRNVLFALIDAGYLVEFKATHSGSVKREYCITSKGMDALQVQEKPINLSLTTKQARHLMEMLEVAESAPLNPEQLSTLRVIQYLIH